MNNHHIFIVVLLFALTIFISCPPKTPVPDIQEQQRVYNIEDLPLSENLVKHIQSDQEEKYFIYTFYTVGDEQRIHKQYWNGLIVLDDLPLPDQVTTTTDNSGNKTIDWRENPLRKSYSKEIYNVNGVLVRRTTINPDGSAVDSVDVNGNGVVDYLEAFLPNGDEMIIATDPLGIDYLKDIFEGTNDHCRNSESFRAMSKNMPGCGSSGSGADGSPGGATNPYDDLMAGLCEGYGSRGTERFNGATRGDNIVDTDRDESVEVDENGRRILRTYNFVIYESGTSTTSIRSTTFSRGTDIIESSKEVITTSNPDLSSRTTTIETTYDAARRRTVKRTVTQCSAGGSCTTRETTETPDTDGNPTKTGSQKECDSSGACTETPIDLGDDTGHPGWETDFEADWGEFCDIWRQSQENRPNDVDELNERANEERCSIEPDEAGATEGSSLAETCYADIEGRDELAEMIAAGTCVTATGGAHFDYVAEGTRTCKKNKFFILEHGLLMNGPTGQSQIELCEDDFACDPADF